MAACLEPCEGSQSAQGWLPFAIRHHESRLWRDELEGKDISSLRPFDFVPTVSLSGGEDMVGTALRVTNRIKNEPIR